MPAASCRSMPARSIRRCDTISASFGVSFRMGRKNRDNRMGTLKESVENGEPAVKPDRTSKHKGKALANVLKYRDFLAFCGKILTARLRRKQVRKPGTGKNF